MRVGIRLEAAATPRRALGCGGAIGAGVLDPAAPPVAIYGAGLEGDAVVLGAWQRAADAVRLDEAAAAGVDVLRRTTGGPTVVAGAGIVYVALALRTASTLLECPPDRVLNRNVRGALVGLSRGGVATMYGGREFLAVGGRPVALVAWDRGVEGRVLVEMFIASERPFSPPDALDGYSPRTTPRLLGKQPTTLAEVWRRAPTALEILGHVVDGYVSAYGLEAQALSRATVTAAAIDPIELADESSLRWSTPREIPIGLASAGIALGPGSRITGARLAGDFFQDRIAPDALSHALAGQAPSRDVLAAALRGVYAPGRAVIEGVRGLDALADALADAAALNP